MKKGIILALALMPGALFAQSRSSFSPGLFSNLLITPSNGGLTYQISLGPSPVLTLGSTNYAVTEVFGFWVLDNNDPNITGSNSPFGVWSTHFNGGGTGAIFGWRTTPNSGIMPGNSETFTFNSLDVSDIDGLGMHVRIAGQFPAGGNTAYFEYNVVPEPASLAALGLGALALMRRRRAR